MTGPDPAYDLQGALATLVPGLVVQRQLLDAAAATYAAGGYQRLTGAQVPAILALANMLDADAFAVPGDAENDPTVGGTYPAALPVALGCPGGVFVGPDAAAPPVVLGGLARFEDSNPCAIDGWVLYGSDGYDAETGP